jgi:membrane fusion protein (multidrug efflux system)
MIMPDQPADEQRPPQPDRNAPPSDLALRMLYDEQNRMRAELETLRQKQQEAEKKESESKKEGGDNKEGDEKDKNDGDEKDKDKGKKPPFKDRARAWIKQHPIATILIVIGVILLIIGTILLIHYLNSYVDTDDAFIEGHTDPISPRISGIATAVYVENTHFVKKGQLLVELDPRDNQVAKEQASANYAQAKAGTLSQAPNIPITATDQSTRVVNEGLNVVNARANVAASEERFRSALADLEQARANEANAAREEERYRLLVTKEEVSREQYDQRVTEQQADAAVVSSRREAADAAAKAVTQAQSQLGQAEAQERQAKLDLPRQIAMQRSQLAQRKASELAAKAQADQSELNLEYTRIYAPEDGIIGDKQVEVGTQLAPGQEMFALTETGDVWITANFKETEIKRMRAGQSVTVYVDALGMKFQGYVEALPGGTGAIYSLLPPENATGNYVKVVQRLPVRIRLNRGQNGFQRLVPGMSVEPKVWLR